MGSKRIYATIEDLQEIRHDIRDIKENHLPHLTCEIKKINKKTYYILGVLAVLIPLICTILVRMLQ